MLIDNDHSNLVHVNEFIKETSENVDILFSSIAVLPGDDVTHHVTGLKQSIKIGGGLLQAGTRVRCALGGTLKYRPPASYWVETTRKRYFPRTGDQILGIIEDRGGDYYKVNIFSGSLALLNRLSFEGASKRNRPELKVGDVVYCRVLLAHKDLETEVTCTTASAVKKEWSSGETTYGQLAEGQLVRVSLALCRLLLLPESVLLHTIGRKIAFEVAVGMNGAVWLRASTTMHTILVRNAILNADKLDEGLHEGMVEHLLSAC